MEKKYRRYLPLVGLLLLALVPLLISYLMLIEQAFRILQPMGQESALLVLAVIVGQMLVFILGLFYVISAFYFSSDLDVLIPLPVKPHWIILSKFTVILANEFIFLAPPLLPLFIMFGILSHASISYWLLLTPIMLLLPVIPLSISALLAVGLMRLVNLSRKKDALIIIGCLFLIVMQFFIQIRVRGNAGGDSSEAILKFFSDRNSLMNIIGRNFPPAVWASKALALGFSSSGPLNWLLLAGFSALLFYGLVLLSKKMFYEGVIGLSEITAKRRKISSREIERKVLAGRHPGRAIFWREVRLMNRTPMFLLNGILAVIIIPAVIIIAGIGNQKGSLAFLLNWLTKSSPLAITLIAASFFLISGCLNGTASSTFSREGRQFWISKVIPVSWHRQILAKFLHSYLVSLLGITVAALVLLIGFKLRLRLLGPALILAMVASVFFTAVAMIIDLNRPLLNWTNPQRAIKQNLNVVIAMVAELGVLAALGFFSAFLISKKIPAILIYLLLLAVSLALSVVSLSFLLRFAGKKYPEIEA
jgi:ABC-2 type transport system permease protein